VAPCPIFLIPPTGSDKKKKHRPKVWLIIGLLMWGINSSMEIVHIHPISHIILFRILVLYIFKSHSKHHGMTYIMSLRLISELKPLENDFTILDWERNLLIT
jgi:hypothetical protein